MNVSVQDKSIGKANQIIITNEKGQWFPTETYRMAHGAKKYRRDVCLKMKLHCTAQGGDEDEADGMKIEAENNLEKYCVAAEKYRRDDEVNKTKIDAETFAAARWQGQQHGSSKQRTTRTVQERVVERKEEGEGEREKRSGDGRVRKLTKKQNDSWKGRLRRTRWMLNHSQRKKVLRSQGRSRSSSRWTERNQSRWWCRRKTKSTTS